MTKVIDIFKVGDVGGEVGVEIEVEGLRLPTPEHYWRKDKDGSLLEGKSAEYVLHIPLHREEALVAIDYLFKLFDISNSDLFDSIRTGVHVHLNVQKMEWVEVMTFLTLYFVLEELLIKYCGDSREGNLFCLRARDAKALIPYLTAVMNTKDLRYLREDNIRYASVNLKALGDYGSLEFRAMRSPNNAKDIKDWINILLQVKDASSSFKSPVDVISMVSKKGYAKFAHDCLGECIKFFKDVKGVDELIRNGIDNAQDLAYLIDWETYDGPSKNPFKPTLRGAG